MIGSTMRRFAAGFAALALIGVLPVLTGCETREKVLDVETPTSETEVYRDNQGNIEVERESEN